MAYWLVGIGGFAGAITRYGVGLLLLSWTHDGQFPLGTLAVNVSGSFLLGCLLAAVGGGQRGQRLRLLFGTGFMGAYTTFSAFSAETLQLLQAGAWHTATAYMAATLLGGLLCAWLGFRAGAGIARAVTDGQRGRG